MNFAWLSLLVLLEAQGLCSCIGELLVAAVRERMRNLPVDSTFVNQPVFVTDAVEGALLDAP